MDNSIKSCEMIPRNVLKALKDLDEMSSKWPLIDRLAFDVMDLVDDEDKL